MKRLLSLCLLLALVFSLCIPAAPASALSPDEILEKYGTLIDAIESGDYEAAKTEFEKLFEEKPVQWITTAGTDGLLEAIEDCPEFKISDEDFPSFVSWYIVFSRKRELLGNTNHLLYICRKI